MSSTFPVFRKEQGEMEFRAAPRVSSRTALVRTIKESSSI